MKSFFNGCVDALLVAVMAVAGVLAMVFMVLLAIFLQVAPLVIVVVLSVWLVLKFFL